MLRHSLHDKRFVTIGNEHGVSNAETVFHYLMDGVVITGTYRGGRIREGHVVGRAVDADRVEMLYHCVTIDEELLAGWSRGVVSAGADGRVQLAFEWAWFTGDQSGGVSSYIELRDETSI
jgi:hypothetical protein